MAHINEDPFDLNRFVEAQAEQYDDALAELKRGQKKSHWMWFIFPQLDGLGFSAMAKRYAITSTQEAEAYLRHPVLGPRLIECSEVMLGVEGRSAFEILGSPDDVKLRSSATLFAAVSPAGSVFEKVLEKYYRGDRDEKTIQILIIRLRKRFPDYESARLSQRIGKLGKRFDSLMINIGQEIIARRE